MVDVQVLGVPYVSGACDPDGGDFSVMITLDEYADTLFVYNGNVQMDLHPVPGNGSGSAVIRPYSHVDIARSASIPTGWMGGAAFTQLDGSVKMCIDMAFENIVRIVRKKKYARIFFPCVSLEMRSNIGTSIFQKTIDPRVIVYVNNWLARLPMRLKDLEVTPQCLLNRVLSWVRPRIEEAQLEVQQKFPDPPAEGGGQPATLVSRLPSGYSARPSRSVFHPSSSRPNPYSRPPSNESRPGSRFQGSITNLFERSQHVHNDISARSISRTLAQISADEVSNKWPPN